MNTLGPGIIITPLAKDELTGPRGERMIQVSAAERARLSQAGPGSRYAVGDVEPWAQGFDPVLAAPSRSSSRRCAWRWRTSPSFPCGTRRALTRVRAVRRRAAGAARVAEEPRTRTSYTVSLVERTPGRVGNVRLDEALHHR